MASLAFGHVLMKLRKARKLSIEELAAKSSVPLSRITGLEKGAREPHLEDLSRLSRSLDLPPWRFMRRVERVKHGFLRT